MSSWPIHKLDEIFEIARGGSPRPIDKFITDDDDGVNWIMIGDASSSSKYIRHTKKKIRPSGVSKSRLVKPGDFLLTNSMSFGHPYILDTHGCIHDGWLVLSPKINNVDQDYFYHLLGSPAIFREFERLAAGATVKNLNIDLVKSVEVALPPLDEQKRIAAILDQADELRHKRQCAIERLTQLSQAIFYEMFGDPSTNPLKWPLGTIGELADSTQYGTSGKAGEKGAFAILRMGNLSTTGEISLKNLKYINFADRDVEKYTVRTGDILFNRTNSPDLVGKTAVYYGDSPIGFAGYLVRLRVNKTAVPEYISAFLNSPFGKKVLRGMCKAIIGMANINAQELRSIIIPIPPVELQQRYQVKMLAIRAVFDAPMKHKTTLDSLFQAIQNRAFQGEL